MNLLAESLLDACAETVIAVDPATLTIVSANRQAENLLGYPLPDLIGRPIADIEVGLQDMFFWEEVKNGSAQKCSTFEGEHRHASGKLIAVQKTVRQVQSGEQPLFVLSVHDITAGKLQEEETARATSLLAATLESTIDGLLVTSLAGSVRQFNHRFVEMWRLPPSLFGGNDQPGVLRHLSHLLDDPSAFRDWVEDLLARPQAESTLECHLLDGRVFSLASRPQQLHERPIGRVFSFHDITSLKTTEAQLIAARDAARAANHAKTEFLSHMSHELRTPLNAILGFGSVLEDELDGPNRTIAQHIGTAGRHLLELINEVLDLASIEAGKMKLDLRTIDLADIVRDCLELVTPLARSRGIALHTAPIERKRFLALADARRLRQMTLNLLSNAIKYNRENGRVEVVITAQGDDHWRLSVADTGSGISEEDIGRLFEPFSRVGKHQGEIEGSGIGLAFTHKLARLMDSQIGVESHPGIGSRFWIDLPCACPVHTVSEPPQASQATRATLLYIEDDALSQKLLTTILASKRPQYRLFTADTGRAGVTQAREIQPDLILLDLQLPDSCGHAILQALRAQPETETIPVVALSGNILPEDIHTALNAGFSAYLTKPLQIDSALASIDNALINSKIII